MDNLTAIILAAGKGSRMKSTDTNKVALPIKGESMLSRTLKILRNADINNFVVVVGFAKDSVIKLLDSSVSVAEQEEQLGTGHAVLCGLKRVPEKSKDVLIVYGDDSFLYPSETFKRLYIKHKEENADITFITMISDFPTGFGRIIRDKNNKIKGIVEEKNATEDERLIKEINLGCYIVNKKYLTEILPKVKKNELTGEYYITDIIDIVAKERGRIVSLLLENNRWRGVNTREDLDAASLLI